MTTIAKAKETAPAAAATPAATAAPAAKTTRRKVTFVLPKEAAPEAERCASWVSSTNGPESPLP
jgi:hypothetical protein